MFVRIVSLKPSGFDWQWPIPEYLISRLPYSVFTEYVPGSTLDVLISSMPGGRLPESLAEVYLHQMLLGLAFLHSSRVSHRNLCAANVSHRHF